MDDDSRRSGPRYILTAGTVLAITAAIAVMSGSPWSRAAAASGAGEPGDAFGTYFGPGVLAGLAVLLAISAFFSAVEVAFFSLHRVRLRALSQEPSVIGRVVTTLMRHPARLLNTILIGNMTTNIVIGVLLPPRLNAFLESATGIGTIWSSVITVLVATVLVLFVSEITPKVLAVSIAEPLARVSALPMLVLDWVFAPARWASLRLTELLFRVTRFNDIPPAPFLTDEEIISVFADSEGQGVIEESEGQMIQAILVSGNTPLREILVPRPDIVTIERNATIREALALFRQHAFSRMPVIQESIDHVTGVIVAKDLLPYVVRGDLDRPIGPLARRASFVPETMTIREFIRYSQRKHMHLSIAVDEYGGTEGLVTLDDALEEVVGDIRDAATVNGKRYKRLAKGCYRVEGSMPLDDLSQLIGVELSSAAHETAGGFLMHQLGRIPQVGDAFEHDGVLFTVEEVQGKRASALRVEARRVRQEQPQ